MSFRRFCTLLLIVVSVDCASDASDSSDTPKAKRHRKSNTITFYLDKTNTSIRERKDELRMSMNYDVVLGYGPGHHDNIEIDSVVKEGIKLIRTLLVVTNEEKLPAMEGVFDRFKETKLGESFVSDTFAEFDKVFKEIESEFHEERKGALQSKATKHYPHLIKFCRDLVDLVSTFEDLEESGDPEIDPWVVLGFWKTLMQKALQQQLMDIISRSLRIDTFRMTTKERNQLRFRYAGNRHKDDGLISLVETVWDRARDEDRKMWHNAIQTLAERYALVEHLFISGTVTDAVRQWRAEHDGSIAVVMKDDPSRFLIKQLRDLGYQQSEISNVTYID